MPFQFEASKCQFIRTYGTRCGSPSLKQANLCYYHERDRLRVENFQQAREMKCDDYMNGHRALQESLNPEIIESLQIPALDDAVSIQVALTNMIRAILYDHISDKKAGLALYGLQLAAMNLGRVQLAITDGESVAEHDPKPIHPFWSGEGYRKHLAQRGQAMLNDAEFAAKRPDKDEVPLRRGRSRRRWQVRLRNNSSCKS